MLKSKLVVFVTDRGFLVPSLIVAAQLLEFGHLSHADIVIYTIDVDDGVLSCLKKMYENKIRFEALATRSFMPSETVGFFANHVPKQRLRAWHCMRSSIRDTRMLST